MGSFNAQVLVCMVFCFVCFVVASFILVNNQFTLLHVCNVCVAYSIGWQPVGLDFSYYCSFDKNKCTFYLPFILFLSRFVPFYYLAATAAAARLMCIVVTSLTGIVLLMLTKNIITFLRRWKNKVERKKRKKNHFFFFHYY